MTQALQLITARFVIAAVVLIAGGITPFTAATPPHPQTSAKKPSSSRSAHKHGRAATAKTPPAAKVIDAEGLQALLKRDGTHPLLVNYWATWCDPCRDEFPDLVKIDTDYRSKGLDFIAVTLDDPVDLKTAVPNFLRLMKAKMPVYLLDVSDPEPAINAVDPKWGGSLPATFLYNNKGEVVYKHFGRFKTAELRAAIEKLLAV